MKSIYKAIAGVFAATALLSGGTLAQGRCESRSTYPVANPASLGVINAIDVVRTAGDSNNSAAGTILSDVIVSVPDHQFSSDAATGAGAIGGAVGEGEIGEDKSGSSTYRISIRLDSGDYQSVMENDLAGLRVGDHIQIDNGHVFQYVVAAGKHYDSGGNPEQSG